MLQMRKYCCTEYCRKFEQILFATSAQMIAKLCGCGVPESRRHQGEG